MLSATTKIVVHSKELKITLATFKSGEVILKAQEPEFNTDLESVTLDFGGALPLGDGELHITFTGELNTDLVGFRTLDFMLQLLLRNTYSLFVICIRLASIVQNTSWEARSATWQLRNSSPLMQGEHFPVGMNRQ